MKTYNDEAEGQREFYQRIAVDPDLSHNTDGVDKGNLYENKLNIDNINTVLFQAIKYASRIRVRGERLPANLILNDLNRECAYIFKSRDFLDDIQKVYFGASSKHNEGFTTEIRPIRIDYSTSEGLMELLKYVNSEEYTRYDVDLSNVVGLSQQFYRHVQDKDRFIKGDDAEIRRPTILSDRINPYQGKDNLEFEDIMDCLNPGLLQREQGAYYTPVPYVDEMHRMLRQAISEIPDGMDYIIIDRCAGTGNLEEGLTDEELSHCVLSTIEYNEYAILSYKYGDKCMVIIPNTDALAYDIIPAEHNEQGVSNDYVRERVQDPNCVIILMENPPYSEVAAGSVQSTGAKGNEWKESFVMNEMRKELKGTVLNDLSNLFIWSGYRYYQRTPHDSFILYSPTKYWRNQELVNRLPRGGFLCDRTQFHANQRSAIGCIWWQNVEDDRESMTLPALGIVNGTIEHVKDVTIRKAHRLFTELYDNREFLDDIEGGIQFEKDGSEFRGGKQNPAKPRFNENIIGYMSVQGFAIDRKMRYLVRGVLYNGHGFFLRSDDFVSKLPMFAAASFPYREWYETDVYSKSNDGDGEYMKDRDFLRRCLIYTALSPANKCRSLRGSDGRFYRNELCLDGDTLVQRELDALDSTNPITPAERRLLKFWNDVLYVAKQTEEYRDIMEKAPGTTLGLWQIKEEINIKVQSGTDRNGRPKMVYKHTDVNTEIDKLERELKAYYQSDILDDLFKYQLLK